jgi:hypothetical protein
VGVIGGGLHLRRQTQPIAGGLRTTGTIVDVTSADELHGKSYTPTIEFTDDRGHVHLFDGPTDATAQKVGRKVDVSYDPADPDRAADVSVGAASWEATFWVGVALAVAEVVVIGWLVRRRLRKPARA